MTVVITQTTACLSVWFSLASNIKKIVGHSYVISSYITIKTTQRKSTKHIFGKAVLLGLKFVLKTKDSFEYIGKILFLYYCFYSIFSRIICKGRQELCYTRPVGQNNLW